MRKISANKLDGKHQEAILLKYDGESYPLIAKKLNVSVSIVKKWFMFDGLLKDEYEQYRDEQNTYRKDLAEETISKNIHTVTNMMVALVGSPDDAVKFRACKDMMDRVLGSPKETIEHKGLYGTGLSYEQILKKARERPPDG